MILEHQAKQPETTESRRSLRPALRNNDEFRKSEVPLGPSPGPRVRELLYRGITIDVRTRTDATARTAPSQRSLLIPALVLSLAQVALVVETPHYSHQHTHLPGLASLGYTLALLLRCWRPNQRIWQIATDATLIWLMVWLASAFGVDIFYVPDDALWFFVLVSPSCLLGLIVFRLRPPSPLEESLARSRSQKGSRLVTNLASVLLATSWQMNMLSLPLTQRSSDFQFLFYFSIWIFLGLSLAKIVKSDSLLLALAWRSACWACGLTALSSMLPEAYERGLGLGTVVTDLFLLLLPIWLVRVYFRERPSRRAGHTSQVLEQEMRF